MKMDVHKLQTILVVMTVATVGACFPAEGPLGVKGVLVSAQAQQSLEDC